MVVNEHVTEPGATRGDGSGAETGHAAGGTIATSPARPSSTGASMVLGPTLVAIVVAAVVLGLLVAATRSAWLLLGAGAGVIPDEYLPLWGFVLVFGTTVGQAVGWAAGTGIVYYVMTLAGRPANVFTWKLAMTIVYAGLGILPLLAYHVLFGGPLLGLARQGLAARLATDYPDAYFLLFTLHPIIDLSLIPLAAITLGCLWLLQPEHSSAPRYALALALIGTSLAVAVSLAVHSTLVHLRF